MPQNILQQNIIKELGLEKLPDERKLALLDKMSELIQKRVVSRLLQVLKGKDKEELEQIMAQKDLQEKLGQFLQEKVPDLEEIVKAEIIKFKQEAKDKVEELGV